MYAKGDKDSWNWGQEQPAPETGPKLKSIQEVVALLEDQLGRSACYILSSPDSDEGKMGVHIGATLMMVLSYIETGDAYAYIQMPPEEIIEYRRKLYPKKNQDWI